MINKNTKVGRPPRIDYQLMHKLEDALQHGANISEACHYAGISRDTFYRYLKNETVFSDKMKTAQSLGSISSTHAQPGPGFINQYNQKQPIDFLTMLQKYPLIFRC